MEADQLGCMGIDIHRSLLQPYGSFGKDHEAALNALRTQYLSPETVVGNQALSACVSNRLAIRQVGMANAVRLTATGAQILQANQPQYHQINLHCLGC
ncbi:MAG: hypothetical protein ACRD5H_00590 [Nitrososphaerales archaeon]